MPPQTQFDPSASYQPASAVVAGFDPNASYAPAQPPKSAISRLGQNFLSGLGIGSDEDAKNFFEHPINTMMNSFKGQGELYQKAKDAYSAGDYKNAVIHGLNYLVPFVGQQTDKAGEQLESGDIAGGVGRTFGAALPIVAGSPEARATVGNVTSRMPSMAEISKPALATVGKAATAIGDSLDPDVVGLVSPRTAHALRLANKVGKVATKYGADAAPEEAVGAPIERDATRQNVPFAGEEETPAASPQTARAAAPPAVAPAAAHFDPNAGYQPTPAKVESLLNDSLGGKPLQPKVPLKQQVPAAANSAGAIPEGFTPAKSSVLKAYKYDPATQEFESITNSGQHYVHGEVTPDQAAQFETADSKGKAWNELRSNATPIAKVINGQRVPVKPPAAMGSVDPATDDLTGLLQQSLDKANAGKGAPSQAGSSPPRFVYRARDVGEQGVPLSNDAASATSNPHDAMKYAEPGQRSNDWGQVVRIDLSKLAPKDYVIKQHPGGAQWVQFTRPLAESEVEHFGGQRPAQGQNVNPVQDQR